MEQTYDFQGVDNNLDMVAALLAMGFSPNVCYHKEKRKVSSDSKGALISVTAWLL